MPTAMRLVFFEPDTHCLNWTLLSFVDTTFTLTRLAFKAAFSSLKVAFKRIANWGPHIGHESPDGWQRDGQKQRQLCRAEI
jgi:hypothetical protein